MDVKTQFPYMKSPRLEIRPEERHALIALTYMFPVEIEWGQCDSGDEWAAVLPSGWRNGGLVLVQCFPIPRGWQVMDWPGGEQWTVKTACEAIDVITTLLLDQSRGQPAGASAVKLR